MSKSTRLTSCTEGRSYGVFRYADQGGSPLTSPPAILSCQTVSPHRVPSLTLLPCNADSHVSQHSPEAISTEDECSLPPVQRGNTIGGIFGH